MFLSSFSKSSGEENPPGFVISAQPPWALSTQFGSCKLRGNSEGDRQRRLDKGSPCCCCLNTSTIPMKRAFNFSWVNWTSCSGPLIPVHSWRALQWNIYRNQFTKPKLEFLRMYVWQSFFQQRHKIHCSVFKILSVSLNCSQCLKSYFSIPIVAWQEDTLSFLIKGQWPFRAATIRDLRKSISFLSYPQSKLFKSKYCKRLSEKPAVFGPQKAWY